MKALVILMFAILLLTAVAIQKRNTSLTPGMTQLQANEYMLRNLQPGHIQFYSRNIAIAEAEEQIQIGTQRLQHNPVLKQGIILIRKAVKSLR